MKAVSAGGRMNVRLHGSEMGGQGVQPLSMTLHLLPRSMWIEHVCVGGVCGCMVFVLASWYVCGLRVRLRGPGGCAFVCRCVSEWLAGEGLRVKPVSGDEGLVSWLLHMMHVQAMRERLCAAACAFH